MKDPPQNSLTEELLGLGQGNRAKRRDYRKI